MELNALVDIWVTTPIIETFDFQENIKYVNLRKFKGNVQESFSKLEYKIYGEVLDQMQKIFTQSIPPINAKDNIYFEEPIALMNGTFSQGVAIAEKPKSQYIGTNRIKNPTYTNIKFIPIQQQE